MDVWALPKCIRKCDIVFRGVWVEARWTCGIIQIPRSLRRHLAKPVNTAGSRSQLGRAGAASSCRCDMRPLVVSDPLLNINALRLWTHTSTEEQEDCKSATKQGQLWRRRTFMHTQSVTWSSTWSYSCCHQDATHTAARHHGHACTTLLLLCHLFDILAANFLKFLHRKMFCSVWGTRLCEGFSPQVGPFFFFSSPQ